MATFGTLLSSVEDLIKINPGDQFSVRKVIEGTDQKTGDRVVRLEIRVRSSQKQQQQVKEDVSTKSQSVDAIETDFPYLREITGR